MPHKLKVFLHHVPPELGFLLGILVLLGLLRLALRPRRTTVYIDPIDQITLNLRCTRSQAQALLKEYDGDSARAISDVKLGRRALPRAATAEDGFAVVLAPDEPKETIPMARLLSRVADIAQPEALALLEPGPGGLLTRGLSSDVAQAMSAALAEAGKKSCVLALKGLPQPVFGGELQSLEVAEHGITVQARSDGRSQIIAREDVQLLCLGILNPESKPASDGTVQASRGKLIAHLYIRGEQPRRYVLEARTISYAGLGELMRDSSTVNFQVLLRKLVETIPEMATNRSVHLFLADMRALAYKSDAELVSDGISRLLTWGS